MCCRPSFAGFLAPFDPAFNSIVPEPLLIYRERFTMIDVRDFFRNLVNKLRRIPMQGVDWSALATVTPADIAESAKSAC